MVVVWWAWCFWKTGNTTDAAPCLVCVDDIKSSQSWFYSLLCTFVSIHPGCAKAIHWPKERGAVLWNNASCLDAIGLVEARVHLMEFHCTTQPHHSKWELSQWCNGLSVWWSSCRLILIDEQESEHQQHTTKISITYRIIRSEQHSISSHRRGWASYFFSIHVTKCDHHVVISLCGASLSHKLKPVLLHRPPLLQLSPLWIVAEGRFIYLEGHPNTWHRTKTQKNNSIPSSGRPFRYWLVRKLTCWLQFISNHFYSIIVYSPSTEPSHNHACHFHYQ